MKKRRKIFLTACKLQSEKLSYAMVTLPKFILLDIRDESLFLQVRVQHKLNREHIFFFSWVVFCWVFGRHLGGFVVVVVISRGWTRDKYHKWKHSSP